MDYWPVKDPQEVLDYVSNWEGALDEGDTITSGTFEIEGGDDALVIGEVDHDDSTGIVWLSAGTHGIDYQVKHTIQTAGGRTMERTVILQVRHR